MKMEFGHMKGRGRLFLGIFTLVIILSCAQEPESVKFPDQVKQQNIHCRKIFTMYKLFPEVRWLSDKDADEDLLDRINQANKIAVQKAIKIPGLKIPSLAETQKDVALTLKTFDHNQGEYKRHTNLCLEIFSPKG